MSNPNPAQSVHDPANDHDREGDQPSLKQQTIRGSAWTLVGYGSSQVLRLGGNLVLTRLLAPEVFGLMALAQTFLAGLSMFSDFGILPSIVQSKRGDEPAFLNTAWTIQILRGFAIWGVACFIAMPVAHIYHESILMVLLPITGFTVVLDGFNSTKVATANRRMDFKRLTILELGSYVIGLLTMIGLAWFYRSVWAIVVGGLVGGVVKMIASHLWLKGERNAIQWNRDAIAEIRTFGRWILVSTMITFLALQGDRLVLGWLLDVRFLGIYTVALGLAGAFEQIIFHLGNRVLFPSYAQLVRDRPTELYGSLRRARSLLMLASACCAIFLVFFGNALIDFLYDDRYWQAGWILRVLAIGFLGRVLCLTYGDVLLARGETFTNLVLTIIWTGAQFFGMFVGYYLAGPSGVVVGIAASNWINYLFYIYYFSRYSLWQPEVDMPVIGLAGLLAFVVYVT